MSHGLFGGSALVRSWRKRKGNDGNGEEESEWAVVSIRGISELLFYGAECRCKCRLREARRKATKARHCWRSINFNPSPSDASPQTVQLIGIALYSEVIAPRSDLTSNGEKSRPKKSHQACTSSSKRMPPMTSRCLLESIVPRIVTFMSCSTAVLPRRHDVVSGTTRRLRSRGRQRRLGGDH